VLLLERILVLVRSAITGTHVDLVEGREHGGGVLALLETARRWCWRRRAHLHALLAGRVARGADADAAGPARGRRAGAAAGGVIACAVSIRPWEPADAGAGAGGHGFDTRLRPSAGGGDVRPAAWLWRRSAARCRRQPAGGSRSERRRRERLRRLPRPPAPIIPSRAPTSTVSPASPRSPRRAGRGARRPRSSPCPFPVRRSGSSAFTVSPGFLNHLRDRRLGHAFAQGRDADFGAMLVKPYAGSDDLRGPVRDVPSTVPFGPSAQTA